MQLENKILFITGGASGIGEACARAYAKAGGIVFLMDKDEVNLQRLLDDLGEQHNGFCGDVKNSQDVKEGIEKCLNCFGKIDVIHNNAGNANPSKPLHQTSEEEWDFIFAINLKSIYWTTLFGLEALKKNKRMHSQYQ